MIVFEVTWISNGIRHYCCGSSSRRLILQLIRFSIVISPELSSSHQRDQWPSDHLPHISFRSNPHAVPKTVVGLVYRVCIELPACLESLVENRQSYLFFSILSHSIFFICIIGQAMCKQFFFHRISFFIIVSLPMGSFVICKTWKKWGLYISRCIHRGSVCNLCDVLVPWCTAVCIQLILETFVQIRHQTAHVCQ